MKKLVILATFLFCGIMSFSQVYTPTFPTVYGQNANRLRPLISLHIPRGTTVLNDIDTTPQIRIIGGNLMWFKEGNWYLVGSSGGGGDTSAVAACYRDVRIDSSDFNTATKFTRVSLVGTIIYSIESEDAPAFLYEGSQYHLVDSGAVIDITDFDATISNTKFTVHAIDTSGTCRNAVDITIVDTGSGGGGGIDSITGMIVHGTNVIITGNGSTGNPYVINSSGGGGGGGSTDTSNLRADINHLLHFYCSQTITYSSSITMNTVNCYNANITLTGNTNIDVTNLANGEGGVIYFTQDATGGRLATFPVGTIIALGAGSGRQPDLSISGGKIDAVFYQKNNGVINILGVNRDIQN